MAAVQAASGTKLLIKIGNADGPPETFTAYCTINAERGIAFSSDTTDQDVPDCDDPDALAWVAREKNSLSAEITGNGVLNTPDVELFWEFYQEPTSRNVMVIVDVPSTAGGIEWTGKFHLTQFEVTGNRGEKMQASLTMVSDGPIVGTPVAP